MFVIMLQKYFSILYLDYSAYSTIHPLCETTNDSYYAKLQTILHKPTHHSTQKYRLCTLNYIQNYVCAKVLHRKLHM